MYHITRPRCTAEGSHQGDNILVGAEKAAVWVPAGPCSSGACRAAAFPVCSAALRRGFVWIWKVEMPGFVYMLAPALITFPFL